MKTQLQVIFVTIVLCFFVTSSNRANEPLVQDETGQALDTITTPTDKPVFLYIVDGAEMTSRDFNKLDMANIEQIEYVKEKEEIKKHTEKRVDTVVLVTMKKED